MRMLRSSGLIVMALLLSACGGAGSTADAAKVTLESTAWQLVELGDRAGLNEAEALGPTLLFDADKQRIAGEAGCNRFMGSYRLQGDKLSFSHLGTTMMACANGMELEQRYLELLGQVAAWRMEGERLQLLDADGEVLASYRVKVDTQ